MSWQQLREMSGDPLVTVGNHGHRHAHMTWLTPDEQRADLALAAARFHTELGKAPDIFAYPYGEISQTLPRNVAEAGFTSAFGHHTGAAGALAAPLAFNRTPVVEGENG